MVKYKNKIPIEIIKIDYHPQAEIENIVKIPEPTSLINANFFIFWIYPHLITNKRIKD
jgi:hypothetical protein